LKHAGPRLLLAGCALLAAAPAAAQGLLAGFPSGARIPAPTVEQVTGTGYRVRISFGDPTVQRDLVFGLDLAEITFPGSTPDLALGGPALPARTIYLRVPANARASVLATAGPTRSLGATRPSPVPGILSDPAIRARFSAASLEGALAGAGYRGGSGSRSRGRGLIETRAMGARGSRVLAVTIRPVSWDPETGEAQFVESVTLTVAWDKPVSALASSPVGTALSTEPPGAVGPFYPSSLAVTPGGSRPAFRAVRAASIGPLRVSPARPWVRLGVIRPGLYEVSSADLALAGVSTAGIDPATFRIFRATPGDIPEDVDVDAGPDSLREISIDVSGEADGSFDPADRIRFYATGATGFGYDLMFGGGSEYQETQHSDVETLWLTWGAGPVATPPRRLAAKFAAPVTPSLPTLTGVAHRVHFEANRLQNFDLLEPGVRWERWFDRLLSQGSRVGFVLQPTGATSGTAADVRVRLWGSGNSVGNGIPDHVARVYWNKALVDTAGWNFSNRQDLSASGLQGGSSDTLEIEVPSLVDNTVPYPRADYSYLAWFEIGYQRALVAVNDTLQFAAPDSVPAGRVSYAVSGISDSTSAWLLDRTDPESPLRMASGVWSGTAPNFTLTVEDSVGSGEPYRLRYTLVSTARAMKPSVSGYAPAATAHVIDDLLDVGNGADYLIVAPPVFLAAAESLAVYRDGRVSGFPSARARIATTDRVFAQFGSGRPSPVAIRNMLLYAYRHWSAPAPTYVCLLGDASYDPKNYLGTGSLDLVPTYSNYYDTSFGQFISDDFYGLMDGPDDLLLDVVIGRLPAANAAEAMGLVTGKLRAYEGTTEFDSWRARALLCADDANQGSRPDPLKNQHVDQMERKDWFHIPFPIERAKVYLNDFAFADTTRQTKPAAREEFISQINRGAWFTDYIGHGNDSQLADEQVLRASDVPRLTNATRPPIFGFFSCTVGKFDEPNGQGLGEILLKATNGGSVASIAATSLTLGVEATPVNDSFMDELFPIPDRVDQPETAGLAFARAKNDHAGITNFTVRKYNLLGDPGLLPPLPRGRGVWEKGPLDSLLRGEAVAITGHALLPDSSADTLSFGTVRVTVLGPPIVRTQTAPLDGETTTYRVPGPVLYRGDTNLSRGSFTARFIVPTDGRIVGSGGVLRGLLSSAGGQGVGLAVDSIRIASTASTRVDATPPTIRLVYPAGTDSTLKPGQQLTIALADSSGIDLTRLDNAHTIFVVFDEKGSPIELTPQFVYDPGSFTQGSVALTVPQLETGPHLLEVHASDTFRNIAVQTFVIDVARGVPAGSGLILDQVFNYPNPFPRETYLHARLNQAARLEIQILTVAGRRVRSIQIDGKAGENYIPWDGRDSEGENVAIGVYLFHVTAQSPSGRASAIGRALRTE